MSNKDTQKLMASNDHAGATDMEMFCQITSFMFLAQSARVARSSSISKETVEHAILHETTAIVDAIDHVRILLDDIGECL